MTRWSRALNVSLVLATGAILAVLLPAGAVAQGACCQCNFNGTNCSACCYADQTPSCAVESIGSVSYCACICVGIGGGGGVGGVGCSVRLDSRTTVMGLDRGSERGAKVAPHQLGYGLLNPGERRDGSYNFEEWAVVSPAGEVLRASTVEFASRVQKEGEHFRPRGKSGASAVLVIEDAEHPQNSLEIPVPSLAPMDVEAGLSATVAGASMWFRAEVGKDGVLDQMILLNVPDDLALGRDLGPLNERLRDHLKLRYADERRHRVVVFGLVRANPEGHLVMTASRVMLPKCCCNGRRCV